MNKIDKYSKVFKLDEFQKDKPIINLLNEKIKPFKKERKINRIWQFFTKVN